MNDHADQICDALTAHEHLAPDSVTVLAASHDLAKTYGRRRTAVRAAGGLVLTAGLVAGSVSLPSLLADHSGPKDTVGTFLSAPAPTPPTEEQELAAYFHGGYGYDEGVQLAALWHSADVGAAKAEAGRRLLAGEPVPVAPGSASASAVQTQQDDAVSAFFAAGYDYNDAVKLGGLWHNSDTYAVKAEAGQKLLDGETLPYAP